MLLNMTVTLHKQEHIGVAIALQIPLFVVITKVNGNGTFPHFDH